ncbi:MAG TPA: 50S ribosomal protein L31e [Thermoprotei archaeon]|nr:50S ribosomal protein L31e [Thermoprotei archaeon]
MSSKEKRVYIINLRDAYKVPRKKRAKKAINIIRNFVSRHTHSKIVKISQRLNEYIWSRNIEKPPRKVHVQVELEYDEDLKSNIAEVDIIS